MKSELSSTHSTISEFNTVQNRCAVLIPVYNNEKSISRIIEQSLQFCSDVIVVDDGSTDNTNSLIAKHPEISQLVNHSNDGKGCAIRMGFQYAFDEGFTHVITLDADGEHNPNEIPHFLESLQSNSDSILIGSEYISTDSKIASKGKKVEKRIARRVGNSLMQLFTGFKLTNSHSNYRLYPLKPLEPLELKSRRFEYEQEILIESAWAGVPLKEVSIDPVSISPEEYVSHTSTVKDFFRLVRVHGRASFRHFLTPFSSLKVEGNTTREKIRNIIKRELTSHTTPREASKAFSLGVFMGIFPVHGFQVVILMLLASKFKLNRPISFLGVNISIAPLLPFIIVAAVKVGDIFLPGSVDTSGINENLIQEGGEGFIAFIVGSAILAPILAVIAYFVSLPIFSGINKK